MKTIDNFRDKTIQNFTILIKFFGSIKSKDFATLQINNDLWVKH